MSEYTDLEAQYPHIAFNDQPNKRDKNHSLLMIEAFNIVPNNWNLGILKQYKRCYTWNSKFYDLIKNQVDIRMINGFPLFDNYNNLTTFLPYEQKKHAVCLICRYRQPPMVDGDITHLRYKTFMELGIEKDCYGKIPYCQPYYRGVIGNKETETYPSSLAKLELLNHYKFSLTFENCYHEGWSCDYITEKSLDAMRARCLNIYFGCSNVEKWIPPELFIDYRQFKNNDDLTKYLNSISEKDYLKKVNDSFDFVQTCRYGNIEDLKKVLDKIRLPECMVVYTDGKDKARMIMGLNADLYIDNESAEFDYINNHSNTLALPYI